MTSPKCAASTIVFAKRFSVPVTPDPTGNELFLSLNARVREGGTLRGTVKDFFARRFVELTPPIRLPCVGTGVWKQAVDDYILELGSLMGHKGRRFDVAHLVRQYLDEHVHSPTEENTQQIATPERFEARFLERAKQFGGGFISERFRLDIGTAISRVLDPIAGQYAYLTQPRQGQNIPEDEYHRLEAAAQLANAWLPEQSTVRQKLNRILDAAAGRRVISTPD